MRPEDRGRIAAKIAHVRSVGGDFEDRYAIVLADGTERFIGTAGTTLHDSAGRVTHVVGACWDMTARHLAEQGLRASEAKHRTLVENIPDVIMRFDAQFRLTYISPSVRNVMPMAPEQFLGRSHRELGFAPEQCDFWERTLAAVFATGRPRETEFTFEADHPEVFASEDLGATPVELVLAGLRGALELVPVHLLRRRVGDCVDAGLQRPACLLLVLQLLVSH